MLCLAGATEEELVAVVAVVAEVRRLPAPKT